MSAAAVQALIGIGSNLGGPVGQVETAFELLGGLHGTSVLERSSLYRSAPFGGIEQPDFVNAAALVTTTLRPRALLAALKGIERMRGRGPDDVRWGPRTIDLDLLAYGNETVDEPGLTVPHPGIAERNFVLLPLREIAPEFEIPGLGRVRDIAINEAEPRISRV